MELLRNTVIAFTIIVHVLGMNAGTAATDAGDAESVIDRIVSDRSDMPTKGLTDLRSQIQLHPERYEGVLSSLLIVPASWPNNDAFLRMSKAIPLTSLLGPARGVPIGVELYVTATSRAVRAMRDLELLRQNRAGHDERSLESEVRQAERYLGQLHQVRTLAIEQLAQMRSSAVVEYSLTRFEVCTEYGMQLNLVRYYEAIGAVNALIEALRKIGNRNASAYKAAVYSLDHMTLTDEQRKMYHEAREGR